MDKGEHQQGTIGSEQALTEPLLRKSEHQHKHKSTLSKIEPANDVMEHTHKTMPNNITESIVLSIPMEPHTHDHEH